ncbi:MAG: gliding motility-associated C-terminal domain-containing protein [Bacteroidales bacterium]|nr:gliding motility-associated C-terminal domain-containing protein [Bacteroidales bacterium]
MIKRIRAQAIWAMWFMITFSNVLFFPAVGQHTSSCPNSNFSLGDFTGWTGYYGDFWHPEANSGFAPTRHTIIKAPVNVDPHTCYMLNPVPPGAEYSLRLGNDQTGAQAEQIRYSIDVTEETSLFVYQYAVVLEDPNHDSVEQPNFTIEVADINGNLIDPICGYYYVYAHQGMPTWYSCEEVVWKDWTTVGIDLTQFIGQTISIKFTTRDCSQTGHFGYAYLSAYCSKVQLTFGFCPDDTVATVTAPPGFSYLWANGDTTQSTTIYNPVFGRVDSCVLTSVNGCEVTVTGTFQPTLINADFGCTRKNCVGASVPFHDSSTINQNTITNWIWDFGDGSPAVTDIQNPEYVYNKSGEYVTTLIVSSTDGCPDTITKLVDVFIIPEVNFTTTDPCGPNSFFDTIYFDQEVQLEVGQRYDHYSWNTGDSSYSILVTEEGWYNVTIDNGAICYASDSVVMLYCNVPLKMPNAFTPNNDGLNDLFRPVSQPEKITTFNMLIFDRWGETIFETQDVFQGWNGTIKGRPAPLGVYVYTVIYGNPSGLTTFLKGTFTLVR